MRCCAGDEGLALRRCSARETSKRLHLHSETAGGFLAWCGLAFAIAFFLMALNWIALTLVNADNENRSLLYGIRLIAFLVIIVGIWDKNRRT